MIKIVKTNSENSDFRYLVKFLDAELAQRDGAEHLFYAQLNKIDTLKYVVLAYEDSQLAGCGAFKELDHDTVEIKRMFTPVMYRGKGVAMNILSELEKWAKELGYKKCVLETGKKQPEAIALYKKSQYQIIPNYGQYVGIENSVCFEKMI
ncbi:MAG TPA: GNAT family N-acetyltransferase [Ginsengibacter sp.]